MLPVRTSRAQHFHSWVSLDNLDLLSLNDDDRRPFPVLLVIGILWNQNCKWLADRQARDLRNEYSVACRDVRPSRYSTAYETLFRQRRPRVFLLRIHASAGNDKNEP